MKSIYNLSKEHVECLMVRRSQFCGECLEKMGISAAPEVREFCIIAGFGCSRADKSKLTRPQRAHSRSFRKWLRMPLNCAQRTVIAFSRHWASRPPPTHAVLADTYLSSPALPDFPSSSLAAHLTPAMVSTVRSSLKTRV
jgi:hypothetical protein